MYFLKNRKSDNETVIYLEYRSKGIRFKYYTGFKIKPQDWNFKKHLPLAKKGRTDLAIIKRELNKLSNILDEILLNANVNNNTLSLADIKKQFAEALKKQKRKTRIKNIPKKTFYQYLDQYIYEYRNHSNETKKKINNIKVNLQAYEKWKGIKMSFNHFKNFDYANFCIEQYNITDNTINKHYMYIKSFVIWAFKKDLHTIKDYSAFKYKTYEPDTVALTKEQVMFLYNYKKFNSDRLQKVIDVFLIGCFTGQRYSDYSVFDKTDYIDGRIIKRQQKTKKKVIIPVDANKYLLKLLKKYDFKLPAISNQKYNVYLREAFKKTKKFNYKIKKISYQNGKAITEIKEMHKLIGSHTARRTFITVALQDGWTYKEVMHISGITDIRTLMKYDKVSNERMDNKVKDTWNL